MLIYLLSCAACFLFGYGALTLLGYRQAFAGAILAAPTVGAALIVIILVSGVLLGVTLKTLAHMIGVFVMCVGTFGVVTLWRTRLSATETSPAIAAVLCPIFLLAPFFRWGLEAYPGSWFWDGWNYIAYAQDLIDQSTPRFIDSSMLHNHLAMMGLTTARFAGSALIGFLSLVSGGADAQFGYGLFLALALFIFSSACGFFSVAYHKNGGLRTFIYVVFAATGGWMLGVVQANNIDSLALVAFAPFLAGLMLIASPKNLIEPIILGIGLAAIVCIQVELAPLAVATPSLVWLQRILSSSRAEFLSWIRWMLVAATAFVVGSVLWLPHAIAFFQLQWRGSQAAGTDRPGLGYFYGLLDPYCAVSSFWGLWSPFERCGPEGLLAFASITAVAVSVFIAIGTRHLLLQRDYAIPGAAALLFLGAVVMLTFQHYDYGAYKFLSIGWFLFAFLSVEGAVFAMVKFGGARLIALAAAVLIVPQLLLVGLRIQRFDALRPIKNMSYYRQITEVRGFVRREPVLMTIDDPEAFEWALFYLRNLFLVPVRYDHPYFQTAAEQQAFLQLQEQTLGRAHLLLTDASGNLDCSGYDLVWEGGAYRLWRLPDADWVIAGKLQNPNGIESWGGVPGTWLGDQAARWTIFTNVAANFILKADFAPGPSLSESSTRTLEITTNSDYHTSVVITEAGLKNISIPMMRGLNRLELRVIERPTQPNGDTRPLLLSMRAFQICRN